MTVTGDRVSSGAIGRNGWAAAASALLVVAAAGCVDAPPSGESPTEPTTAPLYATTLDDGNTVEVYEPSPGLIIMSGSAPLGVTPADRKFNMSGRIADVFKRLRPNDALPDVLTVAQTRQDAARSAVIEPPTTSTPMSGPYVIEAAPRSTPTPHIDTVPDAVDREILKHNDHEWFEATACRGSVLGLVTDPNLQIVRKCGLHLTGGGITTMTIAQEGHGAVLPYRGTVSFAARYRFAYIPSFLNPWRTVASFSVAQGVYRWVQVHDYPSHIDIQYEVYNATDDGYHRSAVEGDVFTNPCRSGCSFEPPDLCLCGV